jgi:hypothetical protein
MMDDDLTILAEDNCALGQSLDAVTAERDALVFSRAEALKLLNELVYSLDHASFGLQTSREQAASLLRKAGCHYAQPPAERDPALDELFTRIPL